MLPTMTRPRVFGGALLFLGTLFIGIGIWLQRSPFLVWGIVCWIAARLGLGPFMIQRRDTVMRLVSATRSELQLLGGDERKSIWLLRKRVKPIALRAYMSGSALSTRLLSAKPSDAAATSALRRGDQIVSSIPPIKAGRPNRDITFISLGLYPRYLEVVVAGPNLPTGLWARLGGQEVRLRKRDSPELVRRGTADVQKARYANIFARSLTGETFSLSDNRSGAETYELRRGDRKGRLLLALPETIACEHGERIVSFTPQIVAGRLIGWAVNPADPAKSLLLELLESTPTDALPKVPPLAKAIAKTDFTLALPTGLFDGAAHELSLTASNGENLQLLWRGTLQVSSEWIEGQIRSSRNRGELRHLLITLAKAERFDDLCGYFANPPAYSDFPISAEDAFEILAYTVLIGGRGDAYDYLYRKFQTFREFLFVGDACQRILLKTAISFLNSNDHDASPRRFPHSPLAEALLDFVFVLEDSSDTDLLRDLISFCTHSRRYMLARQLAERWIRHDPESAASRVVAASIELATGNIETAERLVDQALALKPNFNDALLLLARIYASQGRPLHAAAACSGGSGLSRWVKLPPRNEDQKLLAPLDWPGLDAAIARRGQRNRLLEHIGRADDLHGTAERATDGGFSLVFLDCAERDISALSETLRGTGCVQIVNQHGAAMSEIEGIGRWTLVFCHSATEYPTPDLVEAVFAQKRPFEPMVKLVTAIVDERGKPKDFLLCGALIRTELLGVFGACSLDSFIERAVTAVRVKTLLI